MKLLSEGHPMANEELMRRFTNEYPRAAERLEQFYRTLSMTTVVRETDVEGIPPKRVRNEQYDVQGRLFRFIEDVQITNLNGVEAGDRYVTVANPSGSFQLKRGRGQEKYEVLNLPEYEAVVGETRLSYRPCRAPYSYFEYRIADFIREPEFRLIDVSDYRDEDRSLLKVDWEFDDPDLRQRGWFLFDPQKSWAFHGHRNYRWKATASEPGKSFNASTIRYEGSIGEFPWIRSFRQWIERHGISDPQVIVDKPVQIEEYEIVEIRPATLSPNEFELRAFGLPSVAEVRPASRSLWLFVLNGFVVALTGIVVFWRRRGLHGDRAKAPLR